jgi:zinc protease
MPSPLKQEKRLDVEADVELGRVVLSWPTPPNYTPGDSDLDLLASVLSGGKSSRLYKRLVYDLQIAQDVSAYQASAQLSSVFEIVVTLKKDKSLTEALKVVDEELAQLRAKPPTESELGRARTKIMADLVFRMERSGSKADVLNQYNRLAGDPAYFEKDLARYQKSTVSDLQKAAALHLPADRRIVTFVVPTPGAPRAGRLLGGI